MKKSIRILAAVLAAIAVVVSFSGCNKTQEEEFIPQSAYEVYVTAYNNSTNQNSVTAVSDDTFTIIAEGEGEDSIRHINTLKKEFNSEDDYKISLSKDEEYEDEKYTISAYASSGMFYLNNGDSKSKYEMTYGDVMEEFFGTWLKPVEETIEDSDFSKNDDGGYDINIKIDPEKFVESIDNDEYKYFCDNFYLTDNINNLDINEISIKAVTDENINLISGEIIFSADIINIDNIQNASVRIDIKNEFSGFGDTKVEEFTNLDEYLSADELNESNEVLDEEAEISSEELAKQ